MSKVQPTRPGANVAPRRPGAPAAPSAAAGTNRRAQDPEELAKLRALPAFVEDGVDGDIDPNNASSGKIVDETVTIAAGSRFFIQDWKRKDGSYPEDSRPEMQLKVLFHREGDDADSKPYEENYKFGSVALFAPTKDGSFYKVRPNVIKEGGRVPTPRKTLSGVAFLQSIQDAGGRNIIEAVKAQKSLAPLAGLKIHVRMQTIKGADLRAKEALLVDYIDGVEKPAEKPQSAVSAPAAPAVKQETAAPTVAAPAASSVTSFAEEALVEILTAAANNTIERAKVATTLVNIEKWKTHSERGAILKTLRDDKFIAAGTKWIVNGTELILA